MPNTKSYEVKIRVTCTQTGTVTVEATSEEDAHKYVQEQILDKGDFPWDELEELEEAYGEIV